MTAGILAWHFAPDNRVTQWGGYKIEDGGTIAVACKPVLCQRGLHASRRTIDALEYAPGNLICRVRVSGTIAEDTDKLVGTARKCIWSVDGKKLLRRFTRWCALQYAHHWKMPDVVREYLVTGREDIRDTAWDAASDTAWDAAKDAPRDAAWAAPWAAPRAAAWAAARDAARAAAWAAAWDTAWAAARAAARTAQNRELLRLVTAVHKGERIPQRIAREEWPR